MLLVEPFRILAKGAYKGLSLQQLFNKMKDMKFNEALGIDISKKTIDVMLHCNRSHHQFPNTIQGFEKMVRWAEEQTELTIDEMIICFENTGIYSLTLADFLHRKDIKYSMLPAIEIKRSMGLVRGKNDVVDAERIAEYAYLRRDQIKLYNFPPKNILQLRKLLALRDKLVKQRGGHKSELTDSKPILKASEHKLFFTVQQRVIRYLDKQIITIEKEINELIKSDQKMNQNYELITSVKGIGPVLAANFIIITNNFTDFTDGRKFACYAGIAPFEKQSGTSLKYKSKVSNFANKKMKSLLNMAAFTAILHDPEMKTYYQKRIDMGKSKMSTINIIRNKIVYRVFAVIKRRTPYVVLQKHAA